MTEYVLQAIKSFFFWLYEHLYPFVDFIVFSIYDLFLKLLEFMISLIAIPTDVLQSGLQWGGLPPQSLYIIHAVGVPQFLTIVFGAMTVRFLINLIPATLTRI